MRVLFFVDSLRSGGKERRLVELIKGLLLYPKIRIEIVLTKKKVHYEEILTKDIKIHYILRKKGLKKDPSLFYMFYRIAKSFEPDIIHVWSNLVAIYAIPTKIFLKVPIINNQITNSTKQETFRLLSHRLSFQFSDIILANTYAGLKAYNAPIDKSSVIYNGFDFKRINNLEDKDVIRKRFNINTKFVIAMVASFSKKKDYKTFVKGANSILENRRDITFVCIGSGYSYEIENMVAKNNVDKILFLGKQLDVESIMNICNIGVLLTDSNFHGEGISNVILEFNALSIPVIATEGGGTNEIIVNNLSGFLIKNHSLDELIDRINYLLNNEKICRLFGKEAINIVKKKFYMQKMITQFINVYKKTVV